MVFTIEKTKMRFPFLMYILIIVMEFQFSRENKLRRVLTLSVKIA